MCTLHYLDTYDAPKWLFPFFFFYILHRCFRCIWVYSNWTHLIREFFSLQYLGTIFKFELTQADPGEGP